MIWQDEAIIVGKKLIGENHILLEVLTKNNGFYKGIVFGGTSKKKQPLLQLGNYVSLDYKCRTEEQLGSFTVEPITYFFGQIMSSAINLYYVQLIAIYLRCLPEREAYPVIYSLFLTSFSFFDKKYILGEFLARLELKLLEDLGFGLPFSKCAVTGKKEGLTYVSPKTGNAVCQNIGEPWKDKLFFLPEFLLNINLRPKSNIDILNALKITGYFIDKYEWQRQKKQPPDIREKIVKILATN
ncbi:DNA repair protein RecO [Bartonella sp. DGB1]|uniref:DNA repair protein RecO n=1 Tax=Bartonella sp. DGB1 TaxID=3239807 RepID=UPI003525C30B